MSFKDSSANSVKSLLALLRSTQDDESSHQPQSAPTSTPPRPSAPIHRYTPPKATISQVPSQRQLNDLLASLQSNQPNSSLASSTAQQVTPSSVVQEGYSHVGSGTWGPDSGPSRLSLSTPSQDSSIASQGPSARQEGRDATKQKDKRDDPGFRIMPFSKALSVISGLLGEEEFVKELKRMKVDQDALERRLWAKQERVKAEHEKGVHAEKDIAKITRRPISRDKQEQWNQNLALALDDFYRQSCLPALDGLAFRQTQRLEELGVPGLCISGADDDKGRERVKKIMDVLQGGIDD